MRSPTGASTGSSSKLALLPSSCGRNGIGSPFWLPWKITSAAMPSRFMSRRRWSTSWCPAVREFGVTAEAGEPSARRRFLVRGDEGVEVVEVRRRAVVAQLLLDERPDVGVRRHHDERRGRHLSRSSPASIGPAGRAPVATPTCCVTAPATIVERKPPGGRVSRGAPPGRSCTKVSGWYESSSSAKTTRSPTAPGVTTPRRGMPNVEAMRPVSSCTADSRPRCSPSRTCSVSSSVESPAPHIICRCAPASLAPTTVVESATRSATLGPSLFESDSAIMPGARSCSRTQSASTSDG